MRGVLGLLVVAACGAAVPQVPGKGGPAWRELTSDHFVVWTDAPEDRARELVREIERLRQVVVGTAFRGANGAMKSWVIALRDDDERSAFVPGDFAALSSPPNGNLSKQPVIVLAASSNLESSDRIEAHELVHAISHAIITVQPRWFAEGMAKFYETVELGDHTADVGRAPTDHGRPVPLRHMIPLGEMFACKQLSCTTGSFYVTAWALFTYLMNVRSEQLVHFEEVLASTGDSDRAWHEAFSGVKLEDLEQEVRHWLLEGKHQVLHFNVAYADSAVTERPIADADVYAVRAFMTFEFVGDLARVQKDLDAALALEPGNKLALEVRTAVSARASRP